jgi:glucoamylase
VHEHRSYQRQAFGRPGIEPRWTHGGKDGVGTAYSADSRIWFTLWNGILTEVYYPTNGRPSPDPGPAIPHRGWGKLFHEEKRHLLSRAERLADHALGYCITSVDPEGRYTLIKEAIIDPHLPCVLLHTRLSGDAQFLTRLPLYALCAPHLEGEAGTTTPTW